MLEGEDERFDRRRQDVEAVAACQSSRAPGLQQSHPLQTLPTCSAQLWPHQDPLSPEIEHSEFWAANWGQHNVIPQLRMTNDRHYQYHALSNEKRGSTLTVSR